MYPGKRGERERVGKGGGGGGGGGGVRRSVYAELRGVFLKVWN